MSDQQPAPAAPRVGQMRRTISRSGVALEAWTGAEWLRLKVLSMQEHWADPMAAPGCLIIDLRVEALDVDLDNPPPEPASHD